MKKESSSNKLEPKLRFSKFQQTWNRCRCDKLLEVYKKRNKHLLNLEVFSVNNSEGFVPQDEQFDSAGYLDGADTSIYMIVPQNYFAYNPARINVGSIGYQNTGKDVQVSSLYEVFRTKNELDDMFLWHWFHTFIFQKAVLRLQEGGVRQYYYYDKLAETEIAIPGLTEQKQIANFLSLVDTMIKKESELLETLKKYKRGLVQTILSKYLSDESSEYTLSQILTEYNEKSSKNSVYEHVSLTKEGVIPKSERYERDFLVTQENKQYRITHYNDICYNPANLKFGVICRNKYKDAIFSPIYVTFKVNVGFVPEYIELIVTDPSFIKKALKYQQGTVYERMAVNPEDLLKMKVFVPSEEKQKYIVEIFTYIDDCIANENSRLNMLKSYRRGLLQQMFI